MKNLRTLCAACVLTLVFAMPAFAGYMDTDFAPPPPPPPPAATAVNTGGGNVAGYMDMDFTSPDPVTEAALTLLQIVLSLP